MSPARFNGRAAGAESGSTSNSPRVQIPTRPKILSRGQKRFANPLCTHFPCQTRLVIDDRRLMRVELQQQSDAPWICGFGTPAKASIWIFSFHCCAAFVICGICSKGSKRRGSVKSYFWHLFAISTRGCFILFDESWFSILNSN